MKALTTFDTIRPKLSTSHQLERILGDMANIWELSDLCTPWCIHVVGTLGVAEHMEAGTSEIGDLAAAVGAHTDSLQRVLRHLVSKGIFEEPEPGKYALNEAARGLLEPGMRLCLDLEGFGGRMANAWGSLLTAVRTGMPAYHTIFGRSYWEDLNAHPEIAAQFDALMGPAGHGLPSGEIELSGGWDGVRTVVDVGGGTGTLLAEVLKAHPAVRGILVDQPACVARSADTFRAAGVADRVTTAGQSFFDPLPARADLYLMKNVLADWADAEALAILKRCAEAAGSTGRVVVLGGVEPDSERGASPELLMMVLVGGQGRMLAEFRKLAREAGLEVVAAGPQGGWRYAVECRRS